VDVKLILLDALNFIARVFISLLVLFCFRDAYKIQRRCYHAAKISNFISSVVGCVVFSGILG
jgi:hypothetical protein